MAIQILSLAMSKDWCHNEGLKAGFGALAEKEKMQFSE